MKKGKGRVKIKAYKIAPFIIIFVFIILILFISNNISNTLSQIKFSPSQSEIPFPTNCSNSSIMDFWDSIFIEPFSGAKYVNASNVQDMEWEVCNRFFAYKLVNSDAYILTGGLYNNKDYSFYALKVSLTPEALALIDSNPEENFKNSKGDIFLVDDIYLTSRNISDNDVSNIYLQTYKIIQSGQFSLNNSNINEKYFQLNSTRQIFGGEINIKLNSFIGSEKNYSLLNVGYTNPCTPSFFLVNTSCVSGYLTSWYNDTNSCTNILFRPLNKTYSCVGNPSSSNVTGRIQGNITNFIITYPNLMVMVNSEPLNITRNYSGMQKIEIINNGSMMLSVDYNFSIADINVDRINFIKQSQSDNFGYLIFNGLNIKKTFYVDRIANGTSICIKEAYVNSINEITPACNSNNEFLVSCPGNLSNFSCLILSNKFVVSGLENSAVKEIIPGSLEVQEETTPQVTQTNSLCTPVWQCTLWAPEKCPKSKIQKRTCVDLNNCNSNSTKPSETQTCISKSNNLKILIIIVGSIFILFLVILIILVIVNSKKTDSTNIVLKVNDKNEDFQNFN
ncbi:MAG: hypothetical protein QW727_03480 [Candidatus Pacearchaeota archaeon]